MNKRIKELWVQAGYHVDAYDMFTNMDKFAELIVRECVDICNEHPSRILSNNWHPTTVARDIALVLEEHFGIEE